MTFQHNELSNAMVNYLKKNGYQNVKAEDDYVDISCNDSSGKKIFFELKTAKTVKAAIREAMGQLLEYNHYPNNNKADKLIIVTAHEPEKEDMQYLFGIENYLSYSCVLSAVRHEQKTIIGRVLENILLHLSPTKRL